MRKFASLATALIVLIMLFGLVPLLPPPASAAPEQGDNYWEDTFSDATGISASTNVTVSGGDVKLELGSCTSPYNYVGVTRASGPHDAFYCDVDAMPPADKSGTITGNLNAKTEATDTEYTNISSSDNVRWLTPDPGFNDEVFLWLNMTINENPADITNINLTFEGYSDTTMDHSIWAYNNTAHAWQQIGTAQSITTGTDYVMTRSITSNFAAYIDVNKMDWGVYATVRDQMRIDYVEMVVTYTCYKTPGNLTSTAITPGILCSWGNFSASHTLPSGTDISYKVLKASDDSVLCTITAAQAAAGYDISSCAGAASSIKLYAELSTTGSNTPTLHDWTVTWSTNCPPTVGTIAVSPSSMTPQEQWTNITVPVTDGDTLADVNEVHVEVFYDAAGSDPSAPGTADVQTCAILTWTRGGSPVWSLAPASTTWQINTGGCSNASDSLTTGNWVFSFKVGKVATHSPGSDDWDIYAKATDSISQTGDNYLRDVEMNWYGEIAVGTSNISWGIVGPGCSNETSPVLNITYICNGNYAEQIKTSQNWTSTSGNVALNTTGNPGAGEFSLKADDDDTIEGAVQVLSASYTTFDTGTQTTESGNLENNNHLWLSLGLDIPVDTYSGTLYFGIAQ